MTTLTDLLTDLARSKDSLYLHGQNLYLMGFFLPCRLFMYSRWEEEEKSRLLTYKLTYLGLIGKHYGFLLFY